MSNVKMKLSIVLQDMPCFKVLLQLLGDEKVSLQKRDNELIKTLKLAVIGCFRLSITVSSYCHHLKCFFRAQ